MAYIHMGRKHEPIATSVRGAHFPPSLSVKRKGDSRPNTRAGKAKTGTELIARVFYSERGWNGLKTAGTGNASPPPPRWGSPLFGKWGSGHLVMVQGLLQLIGKEGEKGSVWGFRGQVSLPHPSGLLAVRQSLRFKCKCSPLTLKGKKEPKPSISRSLYNLQGCKSFQRSEGAYGRDQDPRLLARARTSLCLLPLTALSPHLIPCMKPF